MPDQVLGEDNIQKHPEIGQVPREWNTVRLEQAVEVILGQSPPSSTYNDYGDGPPFLQGKAEFGEIYPSPVKYCSDPKKLAPPNSVLISVRAPVGDVNIAPFECAIGRGLAALNPKRIDTDFLFYYLKHAKKRMETKGTGSTFKSINKSILLSFSIPLPPIPEQRAIAHILSTVREAIEATDAVAEATRELKRSLLEYLFTYGPVPLNNAERIDLAATEIGEINSRWKLTELSSVSRKPQYGYTASADENIDGPKFLRITDIQDGQVNWSSVPSCDIDQESIAKYELQPGDVLFARIGATTGKSFLIRNVRNAIFASYLIRVQPNQDQLSPRYLYHFTNTSRYWQQINAAKGGRQRKGVNISVLNSLLLPLPSLREQEEISGIIDSLTRKIRAEQSKKNTLELLFNSLLYQLLTGKIRTIIEVD